MALNSRVDPVYQPNELREQNDVVSLPIAEQVSAEVIRWQLETSNQLLDIEMRLGGFERKWNNKKNDFEYVKKFDALMNEKGISRVMSVLYTVMNVNTILSDFKREEAYAVVRHISGTVIDLLRMNRAAFGVNKSDLSTIVAIVENGIKPTLFRGVDAMTMDALRGTSINRTMVVQQPGGGGFRNVLGRLFGR
jgi:hypothetical protein